MTATTSPLATAVPGTELPTLEIPVTRTLIIAGAIASRDFEPVHHDHEIARERGSADLFMNILTTNGLIGRFVTDWTGPAARLRRIDIRLGVPAYPGDTLRLTGTVTDVADATEPADADADRSPATLHGNGPMGAIAVHSSGGTSPATRPDTAGSSPPAATAVRGSGGGGHPLAPGGGGRRVIVAVRATNARGDHARGTVEVEVRQP